MPNPVLTTTTVSTAVSANLITDFYEELGEAARSFHTPDPAQQHPGTVVPEFHLPDLSPQTYRFFAAAEAHWRPFGTYDGHPLRLLDLAGNPGTGTTKTFPSLLIVARAVEHIRRTGEPLILFTPTSANKGTALRDAVHRAIRSGLADPEQLRVVVLAPRGSAAKLRLDGLAQDEQLAALNPVLTLDSPYPEDVKTLGRAFVEGRAGDVHRRTGARVWYSLDLGNYLLADIARAFFEHVADPVDAAGPGRTHAHAVSSAFGMLGYHRGRRILEESGRSDRAARPHTLLVQHLGTPDMVLNLRFDSFDRALLPGYRHDPGTGVYRQDSDPHFPAETDSPDEVLDRTFYTHRPVTAPEMTSIIRTHGGSGIVVSARECRARYPQLREQLAAAGFRTPTDLAELREWSLLMALTGALNAVDRGLVGSGHDVVVHGSGWYTAADYQQLEATVPVTDPEGIVRRIVSPGSV